MFNQYPERHQDISSLMQKQRREFEFHAGKPQGKVKRTHVQQVAESKRDERGVELVM